MNQATYQGMRVFVLSCFSHVRFFVTLWTVAYQASLSIGFSSQEYCKVAISYSRGSTQLEMEPASLMSALQRPVGSLPLGPHKKPFHIRACLNGILHRSPVWKLDCCSFLSTTIFNPILSCFVSEGVSWEKDSVKFSTKKKTTALERMHYYRK